MDKEILESVLTEILEEQKSGARVIHELGASVKALAGIVESVQKKLEQQKLVAPCADIRVVQEIVADGILKIQQTVDGQPKSVTRNFRFLLFPEMYAENYYRIVFGRLLLWMMIFLFGTYLFMLGKHGIESWALVKQNESKMNQYKKAWNSLYQHEKKLKPKMDSTWVKSW